MGIIIMTMKSGKEYQLVTPYEGEVVDMIENGNTYMTIEVISTIDRVKRQHWITINKDSIESFAFL